MKGNAILRLFDFFNPSKMGQPPPPLYLSDDDVISVVKKLREFSIGPDAWNSDESLRLMQLDMGDSLPEWHFNRLSSFADDQTYQKIFSKLYQVDPEYRKFLKKLPEFSMLSARTGESKARKLILHLDFIDYYKGNFQPIAMKNAVEQLNAYPLIEEAKTVSGFDLYDELDAQIKDTKNEEIKKLLTPFKDKVKDAFLPEYEKRLNAFFNSPLKSVNVAFDELNEMSEIMKKMDLSHETLNNASNYVFKFAKEMIQNSKLIPEGRITNQLEIWDGPLSKLFSDALKNPARSKEDKKMLLDFILGNKEPKVGLRLSKPGTVELVKSMQEVVGGMTPAEVQAWVGRDLRAQYRDELTQLLSEAQKYPQMKKNDAGLRDLVKALDEDRAGSMAGTVYKDFQTTKVQFKMREMMELMQKYDSKIDYMVNTPIQRNINILSVMGADGEFSKRMAKKYSFAEFQKLLKILENQKKRAVLISEAAQGYVNSGAEQLLVADNKGGTFLLDLFDHVNGDAPSLDAWYETYLKVKKLSPVGVRENWQTSDRLGEILSERLKKLSSAEIKVWLKKRRRDGFDSRRKNGAAVKGKSCLRN
jgi:hypothetical protein